MLSFWFIFIFSDCHIYFLSPRIFRDLQRWVRVWYGRGTGKLKGKVKVFSISQEEEKQY